MNASVLNRVVRADTAILTLSDGTTIEGRRFLPIGTRDRVRHTGSDTFVYVRHDNVWIDVGKPWTTTVDWSILGAPQTVTFKEIESQRELELFDTLRRFHYRGGGGAGRTVPLIGVTNTWDLPEVLGFIEISSSMIANTARKNFFNYPYRERNGHGWTEWDRTATKRYSNFVARISRFVIHPEIRGLSLAQHFLKAAIQYAKERWHYGGYRPRFLEITADMLRYYKFISDDFIYLGETEGNEHRLSKDMTYLVKKALSSRGTKGMPQGGGGVMTMQRAYASQLLAYMERHNRSLGEVIDTLHYDPEHLDQETWESLYRLNRRPKPCYAAGVTREASRYLKKRATMIQTKTAHEPVALENMRTSFAFTDVRVSVHADMAQSNTSRRIQDAFGFVGASIDTEIVQRMSFELTTGTVTMICGASGAGKSLLGTAVRAICDRPRTQKHVVADKGLVRFDIDGSVLPSADVAEVARLDKSKTALEYITNTKLEHFFEICAYCGLAEPQLFVRPISTLSSGQRYRLKMALAFLRRPDIVYVDNFCESLDRYTVAAVCRGLTDLATKLNVAVLVATAAYERLYEILSPSQIILLRRGNAAVVRQLQGQAPHEL